MRSNPLAILPCLLGLGCSIALAGPVWRADAAAEQPDKVVGVRLRDGILTANLHEAPLRDVLRTISEVAGFQLDLRGDLSTPLTQSFSLPLDEGIRRLVGRNSLLMSYASANGRGAGRLLIVSVLGASADVHTLSRVAVPAMATDSPEFSPEEVAKEPELNAPDIADGDFEVSPEDEYLEEVCADVTRTEECQSAFEAYGVKSEEEEPSPKRKQ
jgi:hypothetical protein